MALSLANTSIFCSCACIPLGSLKHMPYSAIRQALKRSSLVMVAQSIAFPDCSIYYTPPKKSLHISSRGDRLGLWSNQTVSPFYLSPIRPSSSGVCQPCDIIPWHSPCLFAFCQDESCKHLQEITAGPWGSTFFPPPLQRNGPSFMARTGCQGGRGGNGG